MGFPFILWHPMKHTLFPHFLFAYRTHGVGTNVGMVLSLKKQDHLNIYSEHFTLFFECQYGMEI